MHCQRVNENFNNEAPWIHIRSKESWYNEIYKYSGSTRRLPSIAAIH